MDDDVNSGETVGDLIGQAVGNLSAIQPDDAAAALRVAERHGDRVAQLRREACCPERASRWCRQREQRGRADLASAGSVAWEVALSKLITALGSPNGATVGIVGAQSRGKTCLAVAAIRHFTEQEWACRFATVTELIASFSDARVHGRLRATHTDWCEPRLLVLDQFEKGGSADWEQRFVLAVLDARHNDGRATVLLANPPSGDSWSEPDAARIWGASLQERMNEAGGVIVCRWEGFR